MVGRLSVTELRRNMMHMLVGILIVLFINIYPQKISLLTLSIIIILGLFISLLSKVVSIPIINWFLKNFDRSEDIKSFPGKGALFLFLGSVATLYLYDVQIASAAILILAVGDSLNILIGKPFGISVIPFDTKKMFVGSVGGFVGAFIVASFFVALVPAMIASAVAMIVEMLDFGKLQVNDNILIPIFSGLVLYLLI